MIPFLIWISGVAPDSTRIAIRIPAVVVLSQLSIVVLMGFLCCPDLTSPSTSCDIHSSRIAYTQWIAFLTFMIALS